MSDSTTTHTYSVRPNHCRCHPETCSCFDWAVYGPGNEKHSQHFKKETAMLVADALNATPSSQSVSLEALDEAFNAEIQRVSSLSYNSNEICRHFYKKIRARIASHVESDS